MPPKATLIYSLPVSALLAEGMRELSADLLHAMQALSQLSHIPPRGMAGSVAEIKKAAQGDFDLFTTYLPVSALLVEVSGIEPLTSCMPCKRSPS